MNIINTNKYRMYVIQILVYVSTSGIMLRVPKALALVIFFDNSFFTKSTPITFICSGSWTCCKNYTKKLISHCKMKFRKSSPASGSMATDLKCSRTTFCNMSFSEFRTFTTSKSPIQNDLSQTTNQKTKTLYIK